MRKLLFSRQSECLRPLRALVEKQTHKALALWALDCAAPYLAFFEAARPGEPRPRAVLAVAEKWARGSVKMPEAKKAIHAAHAAAAAVGDASRQDAAVMAAGRAIGHAAATVHVETHALGLVFYGLTSVWYAADGAKADADALVTAEVERFYGRLLYWEKEALQAKGPWAGFLQDETMPNKEALLHMQEEKRRQTQ